MVENLPGGGASRPGDVVRFRSGKTAEVISTDAEGRMILADALDYAREFEPRAVVDLATLTGAMVIALGHVVTGFMANDAALAERLRRAGEASGDRLWELPLWPEYREQLKSDIADMKNSGGRPGGAITAGWFLAAFTNGVPWAHLDIAGTSQIDRDISCFSKGLTGAGVRLLVEFLRSWKNA
jgi:leucyl aminopeptidase